MQKSKRYTITILFLTMFIIMVGFGVIMPILPYYAENMGASATELGLLTATYATLQFFFAPVWGRISDRVGRKPILLLGLFGFTFTFLGFGLSTELWMLFVARGVSGLISSATLPTVMAYIADTTDNEHRGDGMGILGSAMGLGMIFGPVIGGFLGEYDASVPFFVSAALGLMIAVASIFLLPETLSAESRQAAKANPRKSSGIADILGVLAGPLAFLMVIAFLTSFGMAQLESTSALFYERKFGAGEAEMGLIFMVMGIVSSITQGFFVGRVIRRFGEQRCIRLGLWGAGICFLIYPMIYNVTSAMIIVSIMGLTTAFLRPAINSLVSKRTSQSEQGRVLGVVNSYYSLGRMLGPVTGGIIFDYMGMNWPFLTASLIHFIAIAFSTILLKRSNAMEKNPVPNTAAK